MWATGFYTCHVWIRVYMSTCVRINCNACATSPRSSPLCVAARTSHRVCCLCACRRTSARQHASPQRAPRSLPSAPPSPCAFVGHRAPPRVPPQQPPPYMIHARSVDSSTAMAPWLNPRANVPRTPSCRTGALVHFMCACAQVSRSAHQGRKLGGAGGTRLPVLHLPLHGASYRALEHTCTDRRHPLSCVLFAVCHAHAHAGAVLSRV